MLVCDGEGMKCTGVRGGPYGGAAEATHHTGVGAWNPPEVGLSCVAFTGKGRADGEEYTLLEQTLLSCVSETGSCPRTVA